MGVFFRFGVLAIVGGTALWGLWQSQQWQREKAEAATVGRAVKYAVEQFSPAYLDYVRKNRAAPRDNMDLSLPPPRDSLWTGLNRAEAYFNGDVHFEYAAADAQRKPLLVWHIDTRQNPMSGNHVCGARDIPANILAWNGLNCDGNVALPAKDAPVPALVALPAAKREATPIDEVLDAVRQNDPDKLAKLREQQRDLCSPSPEKVTALAEAVRQDEGRAVPVLVVACGVDQVEPFSNHTPLLIAAAARNADMVRALLVANADAHARSSDGEDAWSLVGTGADPASQQIREMLRVKGVDVNGVAADKTTMLIRAADAGNAVLAGWLLANGANPDLADGTGRTALMHAVLAPKGDDVVRLLLSRGAQVNLRDAEGKTALTHANGIPGGPRQARLLEALRGANAKT